MPLLLARSKQAVRTLTALPYASVMLPRLPVPRLLKEARMDSRFGPWRHLKAYWPNLHRRLDGPRSASPSYMYLIQGYGMGGWQPAAQQQEWQPRIDRQQEELYNYISSCISKDTSSLLTYLRWIDDGTEVRDPHHSKVGNGEASPLELLWLQLIFACPWHLGKVPQS